MSVRVVIHESGMRKLTRSEGGPVGRYLSRKANGVDVRAHNNALGQGGGPRPRSRTLFASIRNTGLFQGPQGMYALIGTDAKSTRHDFPYPLALEKGMPGPAGHLPTFANGRTQKPYRYPFLEPALCSEFGKPFTGGQMAGIGDLHAIAAEVLQHCVDALNTIPDFDSDLQGAQDHRYVSFGLPAFDCPDQLTVHVTPISEMDTTPSGLESGKRASRGAWMNHVALVITSTRCVTTGDLSALGAYSAPSPVLLGLDAEQGNADAWALWNHLHNVKASGDFLTLCDAAEFDDLLALIPSGESAGWTWTIRVVLGGYQEPIGS